MVQVELVSLSVSVFQWFSISGPTMCFIVRHDPVEPEDDLPQDLDQLLEQLEENNNNFVWHFYRTYHLWYGLGILISVIAGLCL